MASFTILAPTIPTAWRGEAFLLQLEDDGDAVDPVVWSLQAGTLPSWLSLTADAGQLRSTRVPDDAVLEPITITVRATDQESDFDDIVLVIPVDRRQQSSNVAVAGVALGVIPAGRPSIS